MNSLSFGTGGKDKETGEVSRGWGYYEVSRTGGCFCVDLTAERASLSDHRRRKRRGTELAWDFWCTRTYDEHEDHRPGNLGKTLS